MSEIIITPEKLSFSIFGLTALGAVAFIGAVCFLVLF